MYGVRKKRGIGRSKREQQMEKEKRRKGRASRLVKKRGFCDDADADDDDVDFPPNTLPSFLYHSVLLGFMSLCLKK